MIVGVVAVEKSWGIGKDNTIPWRCKEDMHHFKVLTTGGSVVMGRKTWESLPPRWRPLPNRKNYILTTQTDYEAEGAHVINNTHDIPPTCYVIGGAEIYSLFSPHINIWMVSHINEDHECDAFLDQSVLSGYTKDRDVVIAPNCTVSTYIK